MGVSKLIALESACAHVASPAMTKPGLRQTSSGWVFVGAINLVP